MQQKTVTTDVLDIAYREYGAPDGWPCIMGHRFPYDVNAYAEAAPTLAHPGARVLVPWLPLRRALLRRGRLPPRAGGRAGAGALAAWLRADAVSFRRDAALRRAG